MPKPALRAVLISAATVTAALALAACQPASVSSAFPAGPRPSSGATAPAPVAPTASAPTSSTPTAPAPDLTGAPIPLSCDDLYSAGLRDTLSSTLGPLNATGFELVPTQNADGLEILASTAPKIRCTWGVPGSDGLSTAVTDVTGAQAATLAGSLRAGGYACTDIARGLRCEIEQRTVTLDDELVTRGESHVIGGDRWVSTSWVGSLPAGYTDDVAGRLWG